jgi:hypothetical protein
MMLRDGKTLLVGAVPEFGRCEWCASELLSSSSILRLVASKCEGFIGDNPRILDCKLSETELSADLRGEVAILMKLLEEFNVVVSMLPLLLVEVDILMGDD